MGCEELLRDLVRAPSHRGVPRQEEAVVGILARYLRARGLTPEVVEVVPGRPNLLCSVEGSSPGRHLVLCGHTDTVPLNEGEPGVAFSGEVREGALLGRGACDMKGAVAAMAVSIVGLAETNALASGKVTLAAVIDEEMESLGAEHLVKSGFRADGAIVGEPTGNRLALGHKGLEWMTIELRGRAAHGGTPHAGLNAIEAAARFVTLVGERLAPELLSRAHPLLGPPTINFGTVAGGDQPSTVAARCVLTVDRRSVPGESYGAIVAELRRLLETVEAGMPGLRTSIARMPGGMATLEHLPTVLDAAHPLAVATSAACRAVRGRDEAAVAFPAWTDAALLAEFGGIPSLVLGPGDLSLAHSPGERVPLAEVEEAARIYAATALAFCGG
jgi:acetylornithine deacetylase/succinyl-diaminopimelate desuccinylase